MEIPFNNGLITKAVFNVAKCGINFLEHVQVKVNLKTSQRGHMQIFILSPYGNFPYKETFFFQL